MSETVLEADRPEAARPEPKADPREPWRPSRQGYIARLAVHAVIIAFVLAVPHIVPDVQVNVVATAAVFALVALSMNILMGYTGQVSLGHQAFVGVGAFGAGFAITEMALPWIFGVGVAIITGVVSALFLGFVALRVQGLYLALVTIAYGLLAENTLFKIPQITGGGAGMPAPRPTWATGNVAYVYVCLAAVVLVWLLDWRLTSSKAGRAIQALRDDERVAASWGINVTGYKLLGFVLSGGVAGLAGALLASIEQIVVAPIFQFSLALTFVLMTVVGGLRSRPGVVVGGIVFATLGNFLDAAHDGLSWWPQFIDSLWEPAIGAVLLLATLIGFPGGIAEQFAPVFRWLSFQPFHEDKTVTAGRGAVGGASSSGRP